mgnify:CR=1 FL=1
MKITFKTTELKELLSYHKKMSAASLNKHESLTNVYFYYDNDSDSVSIMSSDGDNVLKTELSADVKGRVSFIDFQLNAERLNNIVSPLKEEEIVFDLTTLPKLTLISGTRKIEIPCVAGDFFFTKDLFFPKESSVDLDFAAFKQTFDLTVFPSNLSSANKIYSSVLLNVNKNELKMVCTDGYLFSEQKAKINSQLVKELVVPIEPVSIFINTIQSLIDSCRKRKITLTGDFSVVFDDKYVLLKFSSKSFSVSGRVTLSSINYPKYSALIPQSLKAQMLVNVKELRSIVSSIASSVEQIELDIESAVMLHSGNDFVNRKLLIFAKNSEITINDNFDLLHFGEECHIVFSSKYLEKILSNIEKLCDWVIIGYNQFPGAVILLPCQKDSVKLNSTQSENIFIIMSLSTETQYQLSKKNFAKKVNNV